MPFSSKGRVKFLYPLRSESPGARASAIIAQLRPDAVRRGLTCTITVEELTSLLVGTPDCYYCGERVVCVAGIDRRNNAEGYTAENVTRCCPPCNRAKGSLLSAGEMLYAMEFRREWLPPGASMWPSELLERREGNTLQWARRRQADQ
jgi:hypothetical protein